MTNDRQSRRLDEVFRAYRVACPDVEGSANFMPTLWQKIEARQSVPLRMQRLTKVFVSAAAVLCLLMTMLLVSPIVQTPAIFTSYIEALDSEQSHDVLAYVDIEDPDSPGDVINR